MKQLTIQQLVLFLEFDAEFTAAWKDDLKSIMPITFGRLQTYEKGAYASIKPILRPLSDITEEEAKMVLHHAGWSPASLAEKDRYKQILEEYTEGYGDVIDIYIGRPDVWFYLLSRGFDLFGWIVEGLAIDKTKK